MRRKADKGEENGKDGSKDFFFFFLAERELGKHEREVDRKERDERIKRRK